MINQQSRQIFIGETVQQQSEQNVKGEFVNMLGDTFYKIKNYDGMSPFFMSIVSSSNHWLFISSIGGLSAGRVSAEQALFPYYTDDKITENNENTGSKSQTSFLSRFELPRLILIARFILPSHGDRCKTCPYTPLTNGLFCFSSPTVVSGP